MGVQFNNAEAHAAVAYLRQLAGERTRVNWNAWSQHYEEPVREGRREEIERLVKKAGSRLDGASGGWPPSDNTARKTRETRLRRMAERRGLRLKKSRQRDPKALDFGKFWLVGEPGNNRIELVDLDDLERYLTSNSRHA